MKLSQICIARPVLTVVLSLVLMIMGIVSFQLLEVRFQPFVFRPHLMIFTFYHGASPALIEQTVTQPLEDALVDTPNLDLMSSTSSQNMSRIILSFNTVSEEQFIIAQSQVLQEISGVNLPASSEKPAVQISSDGGDLIDIGITDPNLSLLQLVDYANNFIVNRLQQVPGVVEAEVNAPNPALNISLQPSRMAALGITVSDINKALENNNTSFSAGQIFNGSQTLPVNASISLPDISAFQGLVIGNSNGRLIRLGDVASINFGSNYIGGWFTKINGKPGIDIFVDAADDANPIAAAAGVRAMIKQLSQGFPSSMHSQIIFDLGQPLLEAIHEVFITILEAVVLVILITWICLGNWRATLIPIVTIPVCLVAAFAIMLALGFTINVMTLLALVLAVGMVVDDSIVVLENSYRHIEQGLSPLEAAKKGINEISFAIIGVTICLVAVYAPVGLMPPGFAAIFFKEFAFTLAGCVLISGFLALTLSPMMCAYMIKVHQPSRYEAKLFQFTESLRLRYRAVLASVLNHRNICIGLFAILFAVGAWTFHSLASNLLPKSELNYVQLLLQGPNAASTDMMEGLTSQFMSQLTSNPGIESSFTFGGGSGNPSNQTYNFLQLKPQNERNQSNDQIAAYVNNLIAQTPALSGGATVLDANGNSSFQQQGDLFFYVAGLGSYQDINQAINNLVTQLNQNPSLSNVTNNLSFNSQSYNLSINRNLVAELGVNIGDLTDTISTMLGGQTLVSQYQAEGQGYPIQLQLPKDNLQDLSVLDKIYVKSNTGVLIPVSRFVTVQSTLDLPSRFHVNQLRAGQVTANINPGYTMGQAVAVIQAAAKSSLPDGMQLVFAGDARNMLQNSQSLNLIFALGLLFIYLVLAALFESFVDPLIILLTIPLCITGALIALKLTGGSLNMYTGIGLVTLIGLVSKHGVLITQFANQLRSEGLELKEALIEAASIRLRPILMTTATMVLGAIPLIFATGTDANGRQQIGWVIVAGLIVGTFFSLFVVPIAYSLLSKHKTKFKY
ncbi:MAG: acriflavin resistance plasma rane protein [Gammaproteobacteria bacterium]|jgi:hydrophobe/amphiphile efflux-1 (HAE1) family protein|nr:acriflavin resistance plasma rane protein [Gammaproteobacteria bacterium]